MSLRSGNESSVIILTPLNRRAENSRWSLDEDEGGGGDLGEAGNGGAADVLAGLVAADVAQHQLRPGAQHVRRAVVEPGDLRLRVAVHLALQRHILAQLGSDDVLERRFEERPEVDAEVVRGAGGADRVAHFAADRRPVHLPPQLRQVERGGVVADDDLVVAVPLVDDVGRVGARLAVERDVVAVADVGVVDGQLHLWRVLHLNCNSLIFIHFEFIDVQRLFSSLVLKTNLHPNRRLLWLFQSGILRATRQCFAVVLARRLKRPLQRCVAPLAVAEQVGGVLDAACHRVAVAVEPRQLKNDKVEELEISSFAKEW